MFWKKKKLNLMNLDIFKNCFPENVEVPYILFAIFIYQEDTLEKRDDRPISGTFYLSDHYGVMNVDPIETKPEIISFGSNGDGSSYAFWNYENKDDLFNVPIVFMGKSWAGNTIMANNYKEFLQLLTLGVEDLGYICHYPEDLLTLSTNEKNITDFRKWLLKNFNIKIPKNPELIINNAKNSHPDFTKWIENRTGYKPEKLKNFWNVDLANIINNKEKNMNK